VHPLFAQEITGAWSGELTVQGCRFPNYSYKKRMEIRISSMDSPKQGNKYSACATTFIDNQLSINAPALGLSYAGKYTNDTFEGVF
jgi:hypothetical protein